MTHLRDGTVADVVSVASGQLVLDHHRDPNLDLGQAYYGGWVKPAEVWHDARLFQMVREVESELAREGASVQRVVLDDELKANAFRALHEAQSKGESDGAAHRTVADAYGLQLEHDRFVFPDVRLEVQDGDGAERTLDLELVTKEYHRGHLSEKAAAGFRMCGGVREVRVVARPRIPIGSDGCSDDGVARLADSPENMSMLEAYYLTLLKS